MAAGHCGTCFAALIHGEDAPWLMQQCRSVFPELVIRLCNSADALRCLAGKVDLTAEACLAFLEVRARSRRLLRTYIEAEQPEPTFVYS